ncbi:hypothetical protein [Nocardioides sp.]|uniref:hypothetical protein n=1 Tax=Nocardioides sp. TaxID=35761 RepID=UPI003526E999
MLLVIGGAGDLATRHLIPGLLRLESARDRRLVGSVLLVDRHATSRAGLRGRMADALATHAPGAPARRRDDLVARLEAVAADLGSVGPVLPEDWAGEVPPLLYLAVPGTVLETAAAWLAAQPLPRGLRVAVEKPFGADRASAASLATALEALAPEATVHRVDHVLHHGLADQLLAWRRRRAPEGQAVERVELTWTETAPVPAERAAGYDRAGAVRDMVQSHLLQLLALVVADLPADPTGLGELAAAKAEALSTVRLPPRSDLARLSTRGRYLAGPGVPAYADLPGVDPARDTETYARVVLTVDDPRWVGVPFELTTGKALDRADKGVVLHLRGGRPQHFRFDESAAQHDGWLPPSARVLAALLEGDVSRSVGSREADEGWRVAEELRRGWSAAGVPLVGYPAGSAGPRPLHA